MSDLILPKLPAAIRRADRLCKLAALGAVPPDRLKGLMHRLWTSKRILLLLASGPENFESRELAESQWTVENMLRQIESLNTDAKCQQIELTAAQRALKIWRMAS